MTLATAILIFGISLGSASVSNWILAQSDPQSGTAVSSPSGNTNQQDASTPAKTETTQSSETRAAKPAVGSGKKSGTSKKTTSKKKAVPVNCDPAPSHNSAPSPSAVPDAPTNSTFPSQSAATTASKNCPPSKVIVRRGGITEQSIQLAGGASGDQAAQKRDSATQLLEATDANLKKIAEIRLSPAQEDSVSQIRQFVTQSKTALASGDTERAHTLAWKAQVLSEDLLNPKK